MSLLARLASIATLAALACAPLPVFAAPARPIEVRVVVVTTWEEESGGKDLAGELYAWRTEWPLTVQMPFPAGVHPLLYDPKRHVLAILTGEATARATASIVALGLDPRFDLRHAYWLVAGTAGVDPKVASVGSVAWARWVVDGDLAQEFDPRDAPADWPTGIFPYDRTSPYQPPPPPGQSTVADVVFALNPGLVSWAFARTGDIVLPDDALLQRMRTPYAGAGERPPFVLEGEGLISARFWYGAHLNDWAERWVDYWTGGKGVFTMSDEEDTGILEGVKFLDRGGRAHLERVLVLRAGSDYTVGPPNMTAAQFMAKETRDGFPATLAALSRLYLVGAPVARYLADHWAETRDTIPSAPPPIQAPDPAS